MLFIQDFKTTSNASSDWNTNLDNSLQSNLYIGAAEVSYGEHVGGIYYEGLVKGYRQMDNAKSSPYQGIPIQYGSGLYGWTNSPHRYQEGNKSGILGPKYVSGYKRIFLPTNFGTAAHDEFFDQMEKAGWNPREFFPSTIPWRPLDIGQIIGQTIINENEFQGCLDLWESAPDNSPEKAYYENFLFEKTLGNCYKYGSRNPCEFVDLCHGKIHEDEIGTIYEPRIPHHDN